MDYWYIRIIKKDGKHFDISAVYVKPYNPMKFFGQNAKAFDNGNNRWTVGELLGIIAWKIGIDKLVGFPEKEEYNSSGRRLHIFSMDMIEKVVKEIEEGKTPFRWLDKEYEKEKNMENMDKLYLWDLDGMVPLPEDRE